MKKNFFKYLLLIGLISVFLFSFKPKKESKTVFTTLLQTSDSWNGDPLPHYPEEKPIITVLKAVIPPKTKLDMHQHGVINAAVVLKGELTVITEKNDTIHLKPNEALSEVVNLWHYGVNNGNTPVELIIFYAGAEGIKNTTIK